MHPARQRRVHRKAMDFEQAWPYVEKARAIAKERGLVISVAVHDAAGHPVALARGKNWHGPYMAMGKARLSAAFRKPTWAAGHSSPELPAVKPNFKNN